LILQCPYVDDQDIKGRIYKTTGGFIVQAIREFFQSHAEALASEVESRTGPTGSSKRKAKEFDRENVRVAQKAEFLRTEGATAPVDDIHHCFVVSPSPGNTVRLGNFWETGEAGVDSLGA
jgi:hypothetical protein